MSFISDTKIPPHLEIQIGRQGREPVKFEVTRDWTQVPMTRGWGSLDLSNLLYYNFEPGTYLVTLDAIFFEKASDATYFKLICPKS